MIEKPSTIVHRVVRVERQLVPIPIESAKAGSVDGQVRSALPMAVSVARRSSTTGQPPGVSEARLAEVERAIAARMEQRLDQKIGATFKARLGSEGELSRTLTNRVYDGLYDRMVLEKERRG
jgi:hypothetical protein